MPAFSFKQEFVEKIMNGTKRSTIRKVRKDFRVPCFAGDRITLYTGMRTLHCKRLFSTMVREVLTVRISNDKFFLAVLGNRHASGETHGAFSFSEREITGGELDLIVMCEGFSDWGQMLSWFKRVHADSFVGDAEFEGYMIEWAYPEYMERGV